ncbi:MAG: 4-hydroxythreonine-4-phosphate dehydrogenase PdxA [Paludibacteraceae bacterium]|nr:4-hydroxythreonine-4-phosphate dehydrogenase PdxA [Paludibacteraceae bacterium]
METTKPIIAISSGDINGIGYEIMLKGLADPHILEICTPIIYGNQHIAREHLKHLDTELHNMQFCVIQSPKEAKPDKLNIINVYPDETPLRIGESTPDAGKASYMALSRACQDLKAGLVNALVTAPINKENIQSDKFRFSGHTEYLTQQFGNGKESLMMMVSDQMKVALVCNHVPIAKVSSFITVDRIVSKLQTLADALENDFMLRKPRIAVLALNPHAGDNGLIGTEEQEVIRPAVKQAYDKGIMAFGPYSADGFFGSGKYAHFDAILAMYHDQGLIPFKSLDMNGVNYTAGLNIIRTSPDHGTAYDLAGKNVASPESFLHALYMAIDLLKTRKLSAELRTNPLPFKEKEDKPAKPMPFKGLDFLNKPAESAPKADADEIETKDNVE